MYCTEKLYSSCMLECVECIFGFYFMLVNGVLEKIEKERRKREKEEKRKGKENSLENFQSSTALEILCKIYYLASASPDATKYSNYSNASPGACRTK